MESGQKFLPTEPQAYNFGKLTIVATPHYRTEGEDIMTILLRLMQADIEQQVWDKNHNQK